MWQTWWKTYQILCPFFTMRQTWRETYQVLCILSYSLKWDKHGPKHTRYYVCSLPRDRHDVKHTRYCLSSHMRQTWPKTYQILYLVSPVRQTRAKPTRQYVYFLPCDKQHKTNTPDTMSILSHATNTAQNKHSRYHVCSAPIRQTWHKTNTPDTMSVPLL